MHSFAQSIPVVCFLVWGAQLANAADADAKRDFHSYANPEHVRVRHLDLNLEVLFDKQVIQGEVVLAIERTSADAKQPLVLDTRGLRIESVGV
jgi:leukotriene-A4 hydrolase